MTGAENLMNTVINSLSMIDKGFTVTLTVTPHNWDGDGDDYEEEDDDEDEPHVSDEIIEEIKEFSRRIDECMGESLKSQMFDHYERLVKEELSGSGHDETCGNWPKVGDEVWYKTSHGNHECGKVKVVCHNTIQLDNNVTLERKDCKRVPFEVGDECWFISHDKIWKGYVHETYSDSAFVTTKRGVSHLSFKVMFSSVDEVLHYLKSTADE